MGTVLGVATLAFDEKGSALVTSVVRGFYAWGLAQDARGDLWVATESGARRLARRGLTTFTRDDGLPALRIPPPSSKPVTADPCCLDRWANWS